MQETPARPEDFYIIQFKPKCIEWQYLVQKLINAVDILAWNDFLLYTHEETGDLVYRLKKERYSAELIAKYTGLDSRAIARMQVIHLDPPAQNAKLPSPTVDGWGTA